jgi:uncharacterized protein (DUF302 family)
MTPGDIAARGVSELTGSATVHATVSRIYEGARALGLLVFARVDHGAGARDAGLDLADEVLLLIGSPEVGSAVMQAAPRAGLDLPMRVLVWDDRGTTRVTWRDPRGLADIHRLDGLGDVLDRMAAGLTRVIEAAL